MENGSSKCVGLDAACTVLAKSRAVQSLLKSAVGTGVFREALEQMKAGRFEGDLGATIHDLLVDSILNESQGVWSGRIRQPHDDYPVQVKSYHGVYWVWALEYDPVGYFLDEDSAIAFARSNLDATETGDQDAEEDCEIRCPYCNSTDSCDHLLLVVDTTFRTAEGGALYKVFNDRWSDIMDEQGEDADEAEFFDELLDEVDSLADGSLTASPESAPGMSSTYEYYFCSFKEKTITAAKKFGKP